MKVDTVLDLEDFKKIYKGRKEDVRIAIIHTDKGEFVREVKVEISAPMEDRILKCLVAVNHFNRYFLMDKESGEQENYYKWLDEVKKKVENSLGFMPIQGYWS
jgi:hypothetical protein